MTHGTLDGYRAHRRAGADPCEPCRRAYERLYGPDEPRADGQPIKPWTPEQTAAFERGQLNVKRAYRQVREEDPCGTPAGNHRHRRRNEPICEACRIAQNLYMRELRTGQRMSWAQCGTRAGYDRHRREGTPTCDLCRAANAERQRLFQHGN